MKDRIRRLTARGPGASRFRIASASSIATSGDGARISLWRPPLRCSPSSTNGSDGDCGRCVGKSGSARVRGHATFSVTASLGPRPTNGASPARGHGDWRALLRSSALCPTPIGLSQAWLVSASLTVASGMSGEPPDADPHVRWCGRGRLNTCPYPIYEARYLRPRERALRRPEA